MRCRKKENGDFTRIMIKSCLNGGMAGAELLIQMLFEHKVEVTFGVPRDTSLAPYEAIHDAHPKIRRVLRLERRLP